MPFCCLSSSQIPLAFTSYASHNRFGASAISAAASIEISNTLSPAAMVQSAYTYMTKTSWKLLQKVAHKLLFIPTTTRTIEQYQRINLGFVPLYALVCNGGILLENGQENMRWYADSRELAAPACGKQFLCQFFLE